LTLETKKRRGPSPSEAAKLTHFQKHPAIYALIFFSSNAVPLLRPVAILISKNSLARVYQSSGTE
jgi:hypothetical protein